MILRANPAAKTMKVVPEMTKIPTNALRRSVTIAILSIRSKKWRRKFLKQNGNIYGLDLLFLLIVERWMMIDFSFPSHLVSSRSVHTQMTSNERS